MSNTVKYSIILILLATTFAYGQQQSVPIKIDGADYYQHGYNKDGGPFDDKDTPAKAPTPPYEGWQIREESDSVTVTSRVKYFVLPNENFNPGYDVAKPLENVSSAFKWTLDNSNGAFTGATEADNKKPLIEVQWNVVGKSLLTVEEQPSVLSCDVVPSVIPITVIPKPTLVFAPNAEDPKYATSHCLGLNDDPMKDVTHSFDMTITTSSSQVWANYTVSKNGVDVPALAGNNVPIVDGKLTITFEGFGRYVVTLVGVTDRISRKSGVTGDITTGDGKEFVFEVLRPVQTNPIYRVPNNF